MQAPLRAVTGRSVGAVCLVVFLATFASIPPMHHRSAIAQTTSATGDSLRSWNDGTAKAMIVQFISKITDPSSEHYVEPSDRIAVFDNDGTLWCENPVPFQVAFALDELQRRSPDEPELAGNEMVQAALAGDFAKLLAGKHHDGLLEVMALTHVGMTTDEFSQRVNDWIESAEHPRFKRKYSQLTYQPMQELLGYLRENEFKCFIVSGGGVDFMRVWSERVYGIPAENIVGTMGQPEYELRDGKPTLIKTLDHIFVDDKEGKPVGIHQFIGRRPIAAFGNSDGDQAMLQYTTIANPLPSLGLIVHHTDAKREYAYDANPQSSGKLTTALEAAAKYGWAVVDMKTDWAKVFAVPRQSESNEFSDKLAGTWLAEDIHGRGVVDIAQSTLHIHPNGTVHGSTSINQFRGAVKIGEKKIRFGPLASTRRVGPPALMDQESKYLKALEKTVGYRITETDLLHFTDANGQDILRFSKITSVLTPP